MSEGAKECGLTRNNNHYEGIMYGVINFCNIPVTNYERGVLFG